MNNGQRFDVAVLGSGPGGYVAAARAAQLGMNTAIIERDALGGVCLNWGCIPTKALMESAHAWKIVQNASQHGIECTKPAVNLEKMVAESRRISERMSKGVGFLMKNRGVSVINGVGSVKLSDEGLPVINVNNNKETTEITTEHLIIATGGRPKEIPGATFDGETIIHSTHAMSLKELPKSLVVLGAGAIGMEFASFYRTLGAEVTIIEMMSHVLPFEDEDIVNELNRSLRRQKFKVLTDSKVMGVDKEDEGIVVHVENKKGQMEVRAEKLLVAIGIQPNIENLGLEKAGIELDHGFIKTDNLGKTSKSGIYAIGDVSGPPLLAHKASAEALICVDAIAGQNPQPINYDHIPGCTYCIPQVASVGITEKKAVEKGIDVKTGSFPFRANGRSITMGETDGLVKLVFDEADDFRLVGAHIMHVMAGELIAEPSVVIAMEGNAHNIARTVHAHPTLSEAMMEAAEDALGRPIHK
jgi:dihydrolipoamide dehydrogenase